MDKEKERELEGGIEPTPEEEAVEGLEAEGAETEEAPIEAEEADSAKDVEEAETEETEGAELPEEREEMVEPEAEPEAEKMLTQSQVNELVGRARQEGRESALRELFGRYGVSGEDELGEIFGRGQAYYDLDDEFKAQGDSYRSTLAENALLKSRADESRWEDIKLILGGKGLDVTMENIESLIPSHPEWRTTTQPGAEAVAPMPTMVTEDVADGIKAEAMSTQAPVEQRATLRKFGGEATPTAETTVESEEERARRLYGF